MTTSKEPFVTEQEKCWILGGEIMDQGMSHGSLMAIQVALEDLRKELEEVQKQSVNLKKFGVGRTEDPTLIIARVVPAIRNLAETATLVADQLTERLKRG